MTDNPTSKILDELKRIETDLHGTLERQNAEIKSMGGTSTEASRKLGELESKYEAIQQDIKGRMDEIEAKSQRLGLEAQTEQKSAGQQFVETDGFKNARTMGGNVRVRLEMKALTGVADSVGNLVRPDRPMPTFIPPTEPHIRDLFAQGTTTANALEFPQFKSMTNNAAPVYDQPTKVQSTAAGSYKPESDLDFLLKSFPVRTVAHLLRVHKNILDDAPALQSIIDTKMLWGLKAAEDVQLIKGDGTGNNLTGILAQSNTYDRRKTGDTKLDTLRRTATQLRLHNYASTGIVLNPTDWEDIELLKDTQGRYIWVSVIEGGVPRVWRTPVVDTQAMDPNQFITGDFKQGGMIFDRQQAAIEVFEQDRDNVPLNLITIRAEERLALVVFDVNAFVKGAFTVA
jgi:HK97 family phage major capsid protein